MKRSAVAIDHGSLRSGFAVVDPLRIACEPIGACEAPGDSDELLEHIATLFEDRDIDTFVVGVPYNMDGTEGPQAAAVRRFGERLRARFPDVRVAYVDERLTTVEADERIRASGRTKDRRALKDSWAAVVLLESWIAAGEPDE